MQENPSSAPEIVELFVTAGLSKFVVLFAVISRFPPVCTAAIPGIIVEMGCPAAYPLGAIDGDDINSLIAIKKRFPAGPRVSAHLFAPRRGYTGEGAVRQDFSR